MTSPRWGGALTAVLVAVIVAGCGGGSKPGATYDASDAERLAEVVPRTPGWPPWPQQPEPKPAAGESSEEVTSDPIYSEYQRKTADISSPRSSGNRWRDDDKLANLVVDVFGTAADAHVAFLASNDLSRAYGKQYGVVVKAEAVEGLGDEAWLLWAHGNGRQVTYHWRRANLVTEVHIHCYGQCGADDDADVDAAARAWAEAIDRGAR